MKNYRLWTFMVLIFSMTLSCVDTTYEDPSAMDPSPLPPDYATMTIAQLRALHTGGDNTTTDIPVGTIITGQVISSDKKGNIYKELYIQDQSAGILLRVDSSPLYSVFELGQELAIHCDDLVLGSYGSNVQLGVESVYNGSPAAGRIPGPLMDDIFEFGAKGAVVETIATVDEIKSNLDDYVGKWVKIENIQVAKSDEGKTYADAINETTQNRYFNDGTSSSDIILRTSGYADFAELPLPLGKGDMYAIVSRFRSDPQLYINEPDTDMVDFTGIPGGGGDGGNTPGFVNNLDESFNGDKYADIEIDGWNNISILGSSPWFYNEFSGNSYANISVYNSGEARTAWLITPFLNVEEASNKTFSFTSRQEFYEGATLQVFISSDYDGQNAPENYTWTELTGLNISNDGNGGYGTWTDSGDIDLSAYGNVVVAFKYVGEDGGNAGGYSLDNLKFNEGGSVDPSTYYDSAEGLTGYVLNSELSDIISQATELTYGELWDAYVETDDKYDANQILWDMYSDIPNPNDPNTPDGSQAGEYEYTLVDDQCGNYSSEGDCYNREHSFPKSYFDDQSPMYTDIHHIVPTDGKVNGERGNLPFGEVGNPSFTSVNGSLKGSAEAGLGFSGTVFEPIDTYKGDFARIYFYMATRYEDQIGSWESNSSNADDILDGSSDKVYEDWFLAMLLKWHNDDPVSQKEIDRNDAIFNVQGNRNPFVDHPEWVEDIWAN